MGSVVQELRATLAEIEQQLDRFNRNADDREALTPVPNQFNAMRGVLSVLGWTRRRRPRSACATMSMPCWRRRPRPPMRPISWPTTWARCRS
jgi:hypothetical protein